MKKRYRDPRQFQLILDSSEDLIEVPEPPSQEPGALNIDQKLRRNLNEAIDRSPFSREEIAAMVSDLVGRKVTKAVLDTYTGAGRPNRLPADLLPALTSVLGPEILTFISDKSGCRVTERSEAMLARLGQLYLITMQVRREQEETLKKLPLFLET